MTQELDDLVIRLRQFAAARNWEQFHSPKNLATALSVEASELLEIFQWLTEEQSRTLPDAEKQKAAEESADVLLYLLQLTDKLGIDLVDAAYRKLQANNERYPVNQAYGSSRKAL